MVFSTLLIVSAFATIAVGIWIGGSSHTQQPPPPDYGKGSMFDLIATRYDMINRVLAVGMDVGWRKQMVQKIKESLDADLSAHRLLDIATGTADVALLLADAIPAATILGVDPSQNMLSVGHDKIEARGYSDRIELRKISDRQVFTEFAEPASFHAATIAFGIRNIPDRQAALCEIRHVLKKGARFCVLEFSEPGDSFGMMGRLARVFIRRVVPTVGGILAGRPREYWHLQESIQNFPPPEEFGRDMEQIECDHKGAFRLDKLIHFNFGSVQLYVTTAVDRPEESTESTS